MDSCGTDNQVNDASTQNGTRSCQKAMTQPFDHRLWDGHTITENVASIQVRSEKPNSKQNKAKYNLASFTHTAL